MCLLFLGCASLPKNRAAIASIEIEGADDVSASDIEGHLSTAASPKFLGLFRGVIFDYEVFDRFVLQRDLQRIERYYRARGYYQARVRAGRVFYVDEDLVRVVIEVEEGPPTFVRRVNVKGLAELEPDVADALTRESTRRLGQAAILDEDAFLETERSLERILTNAGHAYAEVSRKAWVDLPRKYADVEYTVEPGPTATFGEVSISGLDKIPEPPVRRALDIHPGDPYSTEVLEDAEEAVRDLGVFRSVDVAPQLPKPPPPNPQVPVEVKTEPASLKSLKLGGGVELDVIRAGAHLVAGWSHRNLFGGLRDFSVEFKPGVVFYPTRLPELKTPTNLLPEEKFSVRFEQPGFVEARTAGFVRGEYNIFPVLLSPNIDESAPILGYRELKGQVGVRRRFWRFFAQPTHNIQTSIPFTYAGTLDSDLQGILISFVELRTSFDFRDDAVQPHEGLFLGNDFEFAGLGGDARDIKVQPELRTYVPISKDLTLASRASTGFLFPLNYGDTLSSSAATGVAPEGVDRAEWVRDQQLVFFRAFFSGGPNSNRGYPLRGVGPHGVVPFFVPGLSSAAVAAECDVQGGEIDARCLLPLGGLTLWEASLELRYSLGESFSVASFCDASDVSQRQLNLRFGRPHISCGLGGRYGTPVGPIRLDIGYRVPGLQTLVKDTPRSDGDPGTILGIPIAINIGVGEAF